MSALACLVLADQGELDLVRQGRRGVAGVRRRRQGRHRDPPPDEPHGRAVRAGRSRSPSTTSTTGRRSTSLLAAQEPWWEPGTASGYHAITQGYLEGEVVRRITGQTIGEFVAKEITGPLGADFHIGTAPEHDARVAHVVPPSAPLSVDGRRPGLDRHAHARATRRSTPSVSATIPWRRAEIPAAGGHGNARSVALVHAPMACGGEANGVRLLSPKTHRRRCSTSSATAPTSCSASSLRHGIGFGLPCPEMPISPNERACFWGGWGGSLAIIDLDARMSFSYVMNKMGEGTVGDMRGAGLLLAAYMSLASADHPSVAPSSPARDGSALGRATLGRRAGDEGADAAASSGRTLRSARR